MSEHHSHAPTSGAAYRISSGPYAASIASVGASLRQLQHDGHDLVVPFEADELRPLYRGAVLAPWPNRVVDGRYRDESGDHQLPLNETERGHALHGLVAWLDFQPVVQEDDRLTLRAEIVPQQGYPHRVRVDVDYRLDDQGLSAEIRGTNLGSTAVPWGAGSHSYLRAGAGRVDDWTLQLPAREVLQVSPDRLVPTDLADVGGLDRGSYDFRQPRPIGDTFIDHAFTGLSRAADGCVRVTLISAAAAAAQQPLRGVSITWDRSCDWVQVHTADRPDPSEDRVGLAVEPMTCAPDAFNNGRGLVRLAAGADHVTRWRIAAVLG